MNRVRPFLQVLVCCAVLAGAVVASCDVGTRRGVSAPVVPAAPAALPPRTDASSSPATSSTRPAGASFSPAAGPTADQVALIVARLWSSSDTTVDAGPRDTALHAVAWLTPALRASLHDYPAVAGPGADWAAWSRHRAHLVVQVSLSGDDRPADTATTAVRAVRVTAVPTGRDRWRGAAQRTVLLVQLQATGAGWRAASVVPL